MPKRGLVRNNHSFLRHVYRIGKECNPEIDIENGAMIEIFSSIEKLMAQLVRYACHLCKLEGKKRVSELHLERICRNYERLVTSPPPEQCGRLPLMKEGEKDNLLKKQERILEIREQLRIMRMNEVRKETLGNLKLYRKEMRKRNKWFKKTMTR